MQSGEVELIYGYDEDINSVSTQTVILKDGDSFYIPTGLIHRAVAVKDTYVYEFSTQHFNSDSYRIINGD